MYIYNQSLMLL